VIYFSYVDGQLEVVLNHTTRYVEAAWEFASLVLSMNWFVEYISTMPFVSYQVFFPPLPVCSYRTNYFILIIFLLGMGFLRASPMVCHLHLLSLFIWQKLQIWFSNGLLKDLPNFEELLSRGAPRANLRSCYPELLSVVVIAAPSSCLRRPRGRPLSSSVRSPSVVVRAVSIHHHTCGRRPSSSARPPSIVVCVAVLRPSSARPPSVVVRAVVLRRRPSSSSARPPFNDNGGQQMEIAAMKQRRTAATRVTTVERLEDVGLLFYFTKSKWQTIGDTRLFHLPFVLATWQNTRFDKCNLTNHWRCS